MYSYVERAQFHFGKYTEIFFLLHSAILYWIKGFLAISHFFHTKDKKNSRISLGLKF